MMVFFCVFSLIIIVIGIEIYTGVVCF
jgi:hypothetical protein